jgi:hypothetical protein
MPTSVKSAFHPEIVTLEIARLTWLKEITPAMRRDLKYSQIAASLKHVGLIEPIVVFPAGRGKYLVLDGHKRLDIMTASGDREVRCLLATDDESYNYNRRVNYLSPIGEHYMILKALSHGLTEARIAAALNVDVATIRRKRNLLDGIYPETVDILKDKRVSPDAFSVLRKMKPARQIEVAGLMVAAAHYTRRFVQALYAGTPSYLLNETKQPQPLKSGLDPTKKAMLEQETTTLLSEFKAVEQTYGKDALMLSVCCGYLDRLLNNTRVQRYLTKRYPEILEQLQELVADGKADKAKPPRMPVRKAVAPIRSPAVKRA